MAADLERLRAQAQRLSQLRHAKERRDGKAISQETAAYEIGVSARTYRTWEGKGATIKFDNLKAVADYFGTTTGYIEYGEETKTDTPDPFADESQLDRIERKIDDLRRLMDELAAEGIEAAVRQALPPESRRRGAKRPTQAA